MNLLIDLGHPGHVHLFKNLYHHLKNDGHQIIVTTKEIPSVIYLLNIYGIPYVSLGSKKDSIKGKGFKQLIFISKLLKQYKKYDIDLAIGSSISIAQVSKLTGKKSIIFDDDDDEIEPLIVNYGHKFTSTILSPDSIIRKSKKNIPYAGTHELAYLHPNQFSPDKKVYELLNVNKNDTFFILRFVALKGHHDTGEKGLSIDQKLKIVEKLKPSGKIFITTEREIEPELKRYQIRIPPEMIHSALYFATMFVGDSQTMTSEAAILGTPALKCNTFAGRLSVPNELEIKYRLCFSYHPKEFNNMIDRLDEILNMTNPKLEWQRRRKAFIENKIDVTSFYKWFIDCYPESQTIMKKTPIHQSRFLSS